jgi:hypothetical protein
MKIRAWWSFLFAKRNFTFFVVVGCVIVGALYFFWPRKNTASMPKQPINEPISENSSAFSYPYRSYVDGHGVMTPQEQKPEMVGVMIDNSPDVPSQAGLSEAKIVYEALAEGGITRYLAFFEKNQEVSMVGPVRSARKYFLDWLQEYGDAMYLHVGGSPEALAYLKKSDIFDINEFGWGKYFWRSSERIAPHNAFTKSENWQAIFDTYGKARAVKDWQGWTFGESVSSTANEQPHQSVLVPYFSSYKILWRYNTSSTVYERLVNNQPDKDSEKNLLTAANIVVQFTSTTIVDEVGRRDVVTVGSGDVAVLQRGVIIRGTWKKDLVLARTKFFDSQGKEILLVPGKTWVQVVPVGTVLEITN